MLVASQYMKIARILGAAWGIIGIILLLGSAIVRITPHALEAFRIGFTPLQWIVLALWCTCMLVSEGYHGFQQRFAPRVSTRMWHLTNHGRPIDIILAPLYCIGYYGADCRRIIVSWTLTLGITALIIAVRTLPQPWQGVIDTGVVLGLFYGLAWVCIYVYRTIKHRASLADPEHQP
jgi:hypothetical protein